MKFGSIHLDEPLTVENEMDLLGKAGFLNISIGRESTVATFIKAKK